MPGSNWLVNSSFSQDTGLNADNQGAGDSDGGGRESHTSSGAQADESRSHRHSKHNKKKHKKEKKSSFHRHSDPDERLDSSAYLKQKGSFSQGQKRKTIWLEDVLDSGDPTYYEDPRADWDSLRYWSPYRTTVPEYKRKFRHMCLGLQDKLEVCFKEYRRSTDKDSKSNKDLSFRYFARPAVKALARSGETIGHPSVGDVSGFEGDAFLQLVSTDPDPQPASPQPGHARYHALLAKDPHNIELWLQFVDDNSAHVLGATSEKATSEASQSAVLERKMAIVDQALAENPSSVQLHMRRLRLGETLWDSEELSSRWKAALHNFASSLPLWSYYMQFVRHGAVRSSFQTICSAFSKCISTLSSIRSGALKSHPAEPGTDDFLLSTMSSYCSFLQQSGHCERAVATYQAMIEFNLFCPDTLAGSQKTHSARLAFFDAFWESGVGRIGMDAAPGWRYWQANVGGRDGNVTTPSIDIPLLDLDRAEVVSSIDEEEALEEALIATCEDKSSTWVKTEASRELRHWMPVMPDSDADDPDRCVLVEDVRPVLFMLPSAKRHLQLVLSFLAFLGVRVPAGQLSSQDTSSSFDFSDATMADQLDPLCCDGFACAGFGAHCGTGVGCSHSSPQSSAHSDWLRSGCVQRFIDLVFRQSAPCFTGSLKTQLLTTWFQHTAERCGIAVWSCKSVGPVNKHRIKAGRAWAKLLLRLPDTRTNLALWEVYGRFVWACGMHQEACDIFEKILSSAFSMENSSGLMSASADVSQLCRTYVELLASAEHEGLAVKKSALGCLACFASDKPKQNSCPEPAPRDILFVRRSFDQFQVQLDAHCTQLTSDSCAQGQNVGELAQHVLNCACLHGLFLSLTGDLSAAEECLLHYATTLNKYDGTLCRWAAESVLSHLVCLSSRWLSKKSSSLRQHASLLEKTLLLFPHNCEWLHRYCRLLSPSHLVFQYQRFIREHVLTANAPAHVWAVAVLLELRRPLNPDPTQHSPASNRVRRLLEKAFQQSGRQPSLLLWRLALHSEVGIPAWA